MTDLVKRLEELQEQMASDAHNIYGALRAASEAQKLCLDNLSTIITALSQADGYVRVQRDAECERANRLAEFIRWKGLSTEYHDWSTALSRPPGHFGDEYDPAPSQPQEGMSNEVASNG